MAEPAQDGELPDRPDVSHLITEDDTPVDNWFQERQQRLLVDSLYASWQPGRPFLAGADIGLFHKISEQAVVPDVIVSLDVGVPEDYWEKHNRSYMVWEFGKAPDLVVEVVSNPKGGEDQKQERYSRAGVPYYAIFDPQLLLSKRALRVYELHARRYVDVLEPSWLQELGLGFKLWEGTFEGLQATWLRWCDQKREILATGFELAEQAREHAQLADRRADEERRRADEERQRADEERQRAERLEARLRELGHLT